VSDYGFPRERTVVVPNPVRVERFEVSARPPGKPPVVLVLGRIAVRKGIDDVVALARLLLERGSDARIRVVGAPSLFSDYTPLLEDLPEQNAEFAGSVPAEQVPAELGGWPAPAGQPLRAVRADRRRGARLGRAGRRDERGGRDRGRRPLRRCRGRAR
jgi:glycosyltransferase involved in cell wall biosynthesis